MIRLFIFFTDTVLKCLFCCARCDVLSVVCAVYARNVIFSSSNLFYYCFCVRPLFVGCFVGLFVHARYAIFSSSNLLICGRFVIIIAIFSM